MTIQITDIPEGQKLSRITVDFDNGIPKTSIQMTSAAEGENGAGENGTPLDLEFLNAKPQVSQEIVEKPVIKDKKRTTNVASSMQNLKI